MVTSALHWGRKKQAIYLHMVQIALRGNYLCSEFMSGCKTDYTTASANEVRGAGMTDSKRSGLYGTIGQATLTVCEV
jgi:hypothetical protein